MPGVDSRRASRSWACDVVVLGLPRGGVVVASEVARVLRAPLDVLVVRKLGVPFHHELAMGAIGEGDLAVIDHEIVRDSNVSKGALASVIASEAARVDRLVRTLRGARPARDLRGSHRCGRRRRDRDGSTALVACRMARSHGVRRLILAVPVIAPAAIAQFEAEVDKLVWLMSPRPFYGGWLVVRRLLRDERRGGRTDARTERDGARSGQRGRSPTGCRSDVTAPIRTELRDLPAVRPGGVPCAAARAGHSLWTRRLHPAAPRLDGCTRRSNTGRSADNDRCSTLIRKAEGAPLAAAPIFGPGRRVLSMCLDEAVARPAHRQDQRRLPGPVELLAKVADVHVDDVAARVEVVAEDVARDSRPRDARGWGAA